MKTDIISSSIDMIMSKKIFESEGSIPINHHIIDMRAYHFELNVMKIFGEHTEEIKGYNFMLRDNDNILSQYEMSCLMSRINSCYGEEIEQQRDLRSVIDSIFIRTKPGLQF